MSNHYANEQGILPWGDSANQMITGKGVINILIEKDSGPVYQSAFSHGRKIDTLLYNIFYVVRKFWLKN